MSDPQYYTDPAQIKVNGADIAFIGMGGASLEAGLAEFLKGSVGQGLKTVRFLAKAGILSAPISVIAEIYIGDGEVTNHKLLCGETPTQRLE